LVLLLLLLAYYYFTEAAYNIKHTQKLYTMANMLLRTVFDFIDTQLKLNLCARDG